jgi:hypothetical protein
MSCFWDRVSLYRPYISIELSHILGLIRRPWASVRKSQGIETAELAIHEKQRGLSEGHGWDIKRRARYSRCSEESSGESDSRQTRQPSAMTGIHSRRKNPYCQIEHVHNDSDVGTPCGNRRWNYRRTPSGNGGRFVWRTTGQSTH